MSLRCQRRFPGMKRQHACGGELRDVVDRLGRLHWVCDLCQRYEARICRDCPRRMASAWTLRCVACRKQWAREYRKELYRSDPSVHRVFAREWYRRVGSKRRLEKRLALGLPTRPELQKPRRSPARLLA